MAALSISTRLLILCFLVLCTTTNAMRKRHSLASGHRSEFPATMATFAPRGGEQNNNKQSPQEQTYEILQEKLLFRRWRTVMSRLVRFPDGRTVDFDVGTTVAFYIGTIPSRFSIGTQLSHSLDLQYLIHPLLPALFLLGGRK